MDKIKEHLEEKEHVIWDWNGTLLDDIDIAVEVIGTLLVEHGLKPITREEYRGKFCFPIVEYYRRIGFSYEKESFEILAEKFISRYGKAVYACNIHPGVTDFLKELRQAGIKQSVLSAAQQSHLEEMLSHHQLIDYFDHIYGLDDHYAHSKVERGLQLIREAGIDPKKSVLIGDTDHDLEVGQKLGVDVILLADGHQTYERLNPIHTKVIEKRK